LASCRQAEPLLAFTTWSGAAAASTRWRARDVPSECLCVRVRPDVRLQGGPILAPCARAHRQVRHHWISRHSSKGRLARIL
jgi:hypothetical protein